MVACASSSTSAAKATQSHTHSAGVRKTIQSIKEIVCNFSDSDIYMALREYHMDPNETTQRLLHQDTYHEAKSQRDERKESMGYKVSADATTKTENVGQGAKHRPFSDRNARQGVQTQTRTTAYSNAGTNGEFRVVRDNRVNRNTTGEPKLALQRGSASSNENRGEVVPPRGLSGMPGNGRSGSRNSSQASNGPSNSQSRHTRDSISNSTESKVAFNEKRDVIPNSQHHSTSLPPSNSIVGVYSSSTDPVHVPSPESRSSAAIGAIKREVGVVGGRRQSSETVVKNTSTSSSSLSKAVLGRDGLLSESFRSFLAVPKSDEVGQTVATESVMPNISSSRSILSDQYSRPHQAAAGHQKAAPHNKEWKPKSNQKTGVSNSGVIGTPTRSNSPQADNSKDLESGTTDLQDKLSRVNMYENQNVIIAQHIRVPETDRCRLTFGSFGVDFDSTRNITSGFQAVRVAEESLVESTTSFSVSAPESSNDDSSAYKQVDEQVRSLESEHQLAEKAPSPPNLDYYADIGLVQDNSPSSYAPPESQQHQYPQLPSFSAYDPQTGYDMSYFRPKIDESVRGQGLPSSHEVLTAHTANNMPALQQPPMTQMYPQVHVSHFANLMPYRQFLSPVYFPQMAMPGAYPHPSNANSYLLMPGGTSHNGLKYGVQQFKPVPGGSPSGFRNFMSPTGYPMNAEDSSRIKYKDGNLYVPETSEIWVQNGRETGPYYNMAGQTPHGAYMPTHSHTGHTSFNGATQSSHMQFPGLYPMASPHHLGPVMGGNVPGAQVGAYQQPQLGQFNWTTNF